MLRRAAQQTSNTCQEVESNFRCQTVAKIYQNQYFEVIILSSQFLVRGCVFVKVFGKFDGFSRPKKWSMKLAFLPFAMRRSGVRSPSAPPTRLSSSVIYSHTITVSLFNL